MKYNITLKYVCTHNVPRLCMIDRPEDKCREIPPPEVMAYFMYWVPDNRFLLLLDSKSIRYIVLPALSIRTRYGLMYKRA